MDEIHEKELEEMIVELWEAIDDTHHPYSGRGDFKRAEECKENLKKFISSKIQEARGHYGESK
jgi:hypothetical protein